MRISEVFGLQVTQLSLDFVDIDISKDYPLYVDPFLIANSENAWATEADFTIKDFFNEFKSAIISKDLEKARQLFWYMSEPKETCLGVSKTKSTNGRGVGEINTEQIIDRILSSNAIEDDLVNSIEDLVVFVDDIDKDKLSDMVTNLIRGHLISYTKDQCALWGIPLTKADSQPYWNPSVKEWRYRTDDLLMLPDGRVILLVPKWIVSSIDIYTMGKYDWHFVIENERRAHLAARSRLVKIRRLKNGREKIYLPKRDVAVSVKEEIRNEGYLNKKDYIRQYTKRHPELFREFIERCKSKVTTLSNDAIVRIVEDDSFDTDDIIDLLIRQLNEIPSGKENATDFHKLAKSLLEILLYPNAINPTIEEGIHDGRKRIDIVMTNNANRGFFHNLHSISRVFCPYIYIECKNYGKDVANPEIDQLAGRFSTNRGQFGMLVCRSVADEKLLLDRCIDTYKDNRGLIVYLTDSDITNMLNAVKKDDDQYVNDLLEKKKRQVMVS